MADPGDTLDRLSVPGGLVDVAQAVLGLDNAQIEYLQSVPSVLQEAIRGAIAEALNQGKAVHLQYSPGYDFQVRLWDYGEAVSVHLSGPYRGNEAKAAYLRS